MVILKTWRWSANAVPHVQPVEEVGLKRRAYGGRVMVGGVDAPRRTPRSEFLFLFFAIRGKAT